MAIIIALPTDAVVARQNAASSVKKPKEKKASSETQATAKIVTDKMSSLRYEVIFHLSWRPL